MLPSGNSESVKILNAIFTNLPEIFTDSQFLVEPAIRHGKCF
jgi:hypothetical protein